MTPLSVVCASGSEVICPICGSQTYRRYACLRDEAVYRCGGCRVKYRWPRPSLAELDDLYAELYFSKAPKYASPTDTYFQQIIDHHISRVVSCLSGLNVLDFGCGEGNLLLLLRDAGADAYGVEYDDVGRQRAGEKTSATIYKTLDDVPGTLNFDLVIMNEVVEHLFDPVEEVRSIHERIRTGGVLYISTPNFGGLKAHLIGTRWEQYRNKTHLCYFDWYSLRCLGRLAGFSRFRRLPTRVRFSTMGFVRQSANTLLSTLRLDSGLKAFFYK